jgi:hypothetical protein
MRPRRLRSLELDEHGAMLVIATFFAIFAVAILYTLLGVAQTLVVRERLQDAADATALSGAIAHARSMNFLVLVNIVMAALMAILVTIKVVEGLTIVGIAIAAALAWPTAGASLAAIPPLKVAQTNMQTLYSTLEGPISSALSALKSTGDTISDLTPATASLLASAQLAHFAPIVKEGVAVGGASELPVDDAPFPELCSQAGELPVKIANAAMAKVVGDKGAAIFGLLEEPMGVMAGSFSEWFCGEGGSSPPPYNYREKRAYPRTPELEACDSPVPQAASGAALDVAATAQACIEAEWLEAEAAPDPTTGACPTGKDCSPSGPYETRAKLAREQCHPEIMSPPFRYTYQERRGSVIYVWERDHWQRGTPSYSTTVLAESSRPPCGPASVNPLLVGYESDSRSVDGTPAGRPVCTNERPPAPAPGLVNGTVWPVELREITRIFGCARHESVEVTVTDGDQVSGGSERSPKRVATEYELGDEVFQVRALVRGGARSGAETAVRLAEFGGEEVSTELEALRLVGDLGAAQAEYFFGGDASRSEWMWEMQWRARLRRFRAPEDPALLAAGCAVALEATSCARSLAFVTLFGDSLSH